MSTNAAQLRRSGKYRSPVQSRPAVVRPTRVAEIQSILSRDSQYPAPFRPMGANISATDCALSVGTVIYLTGLNRISEIDSVKRTVTAQSGVRICDLVRALAEQDLELAGGHDLTNRTLGGAIAGGCIGPAFGSDGAFFSSQVISLKLISPVGKMLEIRSDQRNLLHAFRMSFGMLGVIYEITLKVRPTKMFAAAHRRCTFKQFSAVAEKLANVDVGLKFFLLPFRDRVYLDIRRPSTTTTTTRKIPWKVKDWGETTVLPHVFKSLNRVVPVSGVRYRIIDEISKLTQGIVNNRLVSTGSSSAALMNGSGKNDTSRSLLYSTWFFPAADFAIVVQAYREFSLRLHQECGFRCDMPAVGFRVDRDPSALLSPSFDEPMIALRAMSTQAKGWENFAIDFSDFARHWGGSPVFNQSLEIPSSYAPQVYGARIEFFRKIRRQVDPENRMMNAFLSQYFL